MLSQSQNSSKKFKYSIENLDTLGDNFKIGYSTHSGKFQTKVGGYLTIFMSLLSIGVFFVVMSQFFRNDSPVVMNSSEFGSQVKSFDLYQESLYPIFGFGIGLMGFSADEFSRFVTIKATVDSVVFKSNNSTKTTYDWKPHKSFDFKPCGEIDDPHMRSYVKKIVDQEGFEWLVMCPDFKGEEKEFVLYENHVNKTFKYVNIRVYPCSLPDPSQCASASEVGRIRSDYGYPFKLLEPSNKKNPMRSAPITKATLIDLKSIKVLRQLVTLHKVLDDTVTSLLPPTLNIEYSTMNEESIDFKSRDPTQLHCSKQEVDKGILGNCLEYFKFEYIANKEVLITRRRYKMLTTMLGEFGGLLKLMTSAVFFFYGLYSMRKVKNLLGDIIFGTNQRSQERLKSLVESKSDSIRDNIDSKQLIPKSMIGRKFNKLRNRDAKMDQIVSSLINRRSSVDNLMQKLNLLDLIEQALFTESEKTLLPLVLLKAEKLKLEDETDENQENGGHRERKSRGINSVFTKEANKSSSTKPFKQAFEELMRSQPNTQFSKAIKEYMRSHLAGTFEVEQGVNLPKQESDQEESPIVLSRSGQTSPTKVDVAKPLRGTEENKNEIRPVETPMAISVKFESLEQHTKPLNAPAAIRRRFSTLKQRDQAKKQSGISFGVKNEKQE